MERERHPDGLVHGVIVAVQRADGCWLLIRRSAHVAAPLSICFPGGGIELGEDHATAAAREFKEELHGLVQPVKEIWQWRCPDRPLFLFGWYARLLTPIDQLHPDPHEVAQMLWLTSDQAQHHPERLFGTELFVQALQSYLQTTQGNGIEQR